MKYHQIEAFYQVMLTRSMSQAAVNLGRTQPAVSMTIAGLEALLGTRLFDRHAGRLHPRAEAHVLFERVSPIIGQFDEIQASFRRPEAFAVPRIAIIASNNPGMHLVPSALTPLAAGGQSFQLMDGTTGAIVSEVEGQRYDIGVTDEGPAEIRFDSPLYEARSFEIPVHAVCRAGLLGEAGAAVTVDRLKDRPVYTLRPEHRMGKDIRARLPEPPMEFGSFFPMACHALRSSGIAIVDAITCGAIEALTGEAFQSRSHPIEDVAPAKYYLLRPRFRPRSEIADRTHAAIEASLERFRFDPSAGRRSA